MGSQAPFSVPLPSGHELVVIQPYVQAESTGIIVVTVAATLSLLCAVAMLVILFTSLLKRKSNEHFFVRTHAGAYFISMLIADILQAIGTMFNIRWVERGGVNLSSFCSVQGAIKNVGNLSVSLWTLTLSVYVFVLLFLRKSPPDWTLYATLCGVWGLIGFLLLIGPAFIENFKNNGPYYGVSGYWCWITDGYQSERVGLEYAWMFGCAIISFILYTLVYLRLRGNIFYERRLRFRWLSRANAWKVELDRDAVDLQMTDVAKALIGFPVMFTVIILPIAFCRFLAWGGHDVSFDASIFSDAIFSLTGVFNLIIFVTARSLLPGSSMLPGFLTSRQRFVQHSEVTEHGVQPYVVGDFASAHGFSEMYQSEAEKTQAIPPRTEASMGGSYIPNPFQDPAGVPASPTGTVRSFSSAEAKGPLQIQTNAQWDAIDLTRPTPISPGRGDRFEDPRPAPTPHRNAEFSPEDEGLGHGDRLTVQTHGEHEHDPHKSIGGLSYYYGSPSREHPAEDVPPLPTHRF